MEVRVLAAEDVRPPLRARDPGQCRQRSTDRDEQQAVGEVAVEDQADQLALPNGGLHFCCKFIEMHVTGVAVISRAHDTDLRFIEVVFRQPLGGDLEDGLLIEQEGDGAGRAQVAAQRGAALNLGGADEVGGFGDSVNEFCFVHNKAPQFEQGWPAPSNE